tara:strand:+ start:2801 stop:5338 length:2538 start_codon:yes stop_codon:yes gene_type:complete
MNFYRTLVLIYFIYFLTADLFAHKDHKDEPKMPAIGIVKGMILDSVSSSPLQYASISLINLHSNEVVTGALSEENGLFIIREVPLGKYKAVIEFIGYKKKEISDINLFPGQGGGIEQSLGNINLKVSSINLAGVEVLGESQFIQTIDKQIFTVGKNLASAGGSGSDVLRKVPSLDVDIDGVISIAGDANVTVLIDGKRSGLTGSGRRGNVDNIAASMIEKIEVITNPSAKYDPDGVGGIINIVLKRGSFDGLNGTVSAMAGERGKQNLNGNLNFRTNSWNLFGSANFKTGERFGKGIRQFQNVYSNPDRTDSLFQTTKRSQIPKNISARLGADYYLSKNSTLGYSFDVLDHRDLTEQKFNYLTNDIDTLVLGQINTKKYDNGYHLDHVLSYENRFSSDNQLLKAFTSFSHEIDDVHEHGGSDSETNSISSNDKTNAFEENNNLTVAIDYTDRFKDKIGIEVGAKATVRNFGTDLTYLSDKYTSNYSEDIYAAYLVSQYELTDRFGLKFGARLEQVETKASVEGPLEHVDSTLITKIFDNAIDNSPFNNPYFQIYPSAFLLFKLTEKQNLQFGYSKKVNRPNRRTLSPFPNNTQDISRVRNGNPFLRPEYSDVIELKFSSNSRKYNLNTSLSFKNTEDVIMWWDRDYVEFDGKSYEIMTAGNAEKSESINYSGNLMFRPMPLASIMFWGYGWNSTLSDKGEADFNGNSKGTGLGGQLTLNLPRVARLEFSVRGRGKMKITTGTIPSNFSADLGIQKSFLQNKLSLTLKVSDLFDTGKFIIDTSNEVDPTDPDLDSYTRLMYAERQREVRFTSVVLNYNFGKKQNKRWNKNNMRGGGGGGGGMDMDF